MDITHITSLLGGIALFLYGMSIMGAGLEKLAGGKMQGVLQKLTSSTIKGVIFGTLITGVIQSSAGTVVICVGLVNSGIMTLTQSVGVIMGANIGNIAYFRLSAVPYSVNLINEHISVIHDYLVLFAFDVGAVNDFYLAFGSTQLYDLFVQIINRTVCQCFACSYGYLIGIEHFAVFFGAYEYTCK